jgi:hypothetical protein
LRALIITLNGDNPATAAPGAQRFNFQMTSELIEISQEGSNT